jgi:hypothetical protein
VKKLSTIIPVKSCLLNLCSRIQPSNFLLILIVSASVGDNVELLVAVVSGESDLELV